MPSKLDDARKIIDDVDSHMAALFVKRMRAVELVCEYKKERGLPILNQDREDALIEKNSALIEDEVLKGYYIDYLKHLMSVSRAYQYRMQKGLRVAYSSVEDLCTSVAVGKIFPESSGFSYSDFKTAYDAVVDGECDVAVLPIENSYGGEVGQTVDLIFSGCLFINGMYDLGLLDANLGKRAESSTRFVVLSKVQESSSSLPHSVLMLTVRNEAGSLADAISIIGEYGYNITALRSRPLKNRSWQDYFYIEIDGRVDTENGECMLAELSRECDRVKVAGSFAPHVEI